MFNSTEPMPVAQKRSTDGRPRSVSPHRNIVKVALHEGGFTLAELLVSIAALVLLVFLFTQLLNNVATVMTLGNKVMDVDSSARQVLDRMAIDFGQMVKRTDVSYYVKALGNTEVGNDQIAFFCSAPGYYPPNGAQSPVSVVAYRVNSLLASQSYNKLERLAKGLLWNGASHGYHTSGFFAYDD